MYVPIDASTHIGLVALSVSNLDRSLNFYQHQIGLEILEHTDGLATLGVAKRPLVRLNEVPGAQLIRRATGLYHFALRVPTRRDLARVIRHFANDRTPIDGASDHGVSEALYLSDPDGHGIEIYRDRPATTWRDTSGTMRAVSDPLDFQSIIAEVQGDTASWNGLPAGTDMGHIHLQVADIAAAEQFYHDVLGFERMMRMPSASFISAGGYHHHIGMNTWAGVGVKPPPDTAARLLSYEVLLPTQDALQAVIDRVSAASIALAQDVDGWAVYDPSHNLVQLRVASA